MPTPAAVATLPGAADGFEMAILATLHTPLALLGALLLAYAWLEVFDRKGRAVGTVARITARYAPDGEEIVVAEVAFTVDDRYHSFLPTNALSREAKNVGAKVPVAYNCDYPDDADVVTPIGLYLPPGVATVFYALFVCWWMTRGL